MTSILMPGSGCEGTGRPALRSPSCSSLPTTTSRWSPGFRALGCDIPIIPGIMPITNVRQVTRFAELSGAALPKSVTDRINEVADDDDQVRRVGIRIGTELSEELLSRGAPGLHFFTQNRSRATREIYANLHQVRRRA